ncbi:MAG: hypothetical protein RB296_10350 [Acidobacteriota bacterium]|jgi:ribosomal protein S18 acetylase RimI-like enzyme|nr:hypothetical protein [Acidobacteriota bacterium]
MNVDIQTVESKKQLKQFVKMPLRFFADNPYWVPPLLMDELETLDSRRNPAFERAESRMFMAFRNHQPVGRIAAILSHAANEKYATRNLRFGWFDVIDDYAVAEALLAAAESWGRERGMTTITGPQGFSDMDAEGMLIEGFDLVPTIAQIYNPPFYPRFLERYGFEKEIDYLEFRAKIPTELPERLLNLAERLKQRSNLSVLECKSKRRLLEYAHPIFELLDETFAEIYGSVPTTKKQTDYYTKKYAMFLDPRLCKVVVNPENEVVGFMISMPSMSAAFQKARGRVLPFGWFHLLRGLRQRKVLDFYLAGVKQKYRGLGVDLMMVLAVAQNAMKMGFEIAESNVELETNTKIHAQWKFFEHYQARRRRIFRKRIA